MDALEKSKRRVASLWLLHSLRLACGLPRGAEQQLHPRRSVHAKSVRLVRQHSKWKAAIGQEARGRDGRHRSWGGPIDAATNSTLLAPPPTTILIAHAHTLVPTKGFDAGTALGGTRPARRHARKRSRDHRARRGLG